MKGRRCEGPECTRAGGYDGLCEAHRHQAAVRGRKNMEFLRPFQKKESLEGRLRRKTKKRKNGCWLWTGGTSKGYGVTYDSEARKHRFVHRIGMERKLGRRLGRYEFVDHRCRRRNCVNPKHLDLVTRRENTKRMLAWRSLMAENRRLKKRIAFLERKLRAM